MKPRSQHPSVRAGIIALAMLVCTLVPDAMAASKAPTLRLVNDTVVAMVNGKPTPLPGAKGISVRNSTTLQFASVGENSLGVPEGDYVFNAKGERTAFLPIDETDNTAAMSIAPNGKVIAVDGGTYVIRGWSFFTYPEMKPFKQGITYYSGNQNAQLTWVDSNTVVYTAPAETGRSCQYDPCEGQSVMVFTIDPPKETPLLPATDLCNYELVSVESGKVTANKRCLPSVQAWEPGDYENYPTERVTVDLVR